MFHLQANADVRHGLEHPRKDLEQNTIATATVLEAMRAQDVTRIAFSSTGSVYGEPEVFPTPRTRRSRCQTSLYAASKLAGEGMIGAYAHGFGFTGVVFRFVSILGERYTHGHVYDFYCALKRDPHHLRVLGDGRQEKSYLYVERLRRGDHDAAAEAHEPGREKLGVYNLGTDETVIVDDSVGADRRSHGARAGDRVHRRQARVAGDSPLICSTARGSARSAGRLRSAIDRRSCARWNGSTPTRTPGRARSPRERGPHERHLQPGPAAYLPRRRAEPICPPTTASTAASSSRAQSTSTSTC